MDNKQAEREAFEKWAASPKSMADMSPEGVWAAARAALRAEQQGQNAVAWLAERGRTRIPCLAEDSAQEIAGPTGTVTPLYTHSAPASQPMGEAVADDVCEHCRDGHVVWTFDGRRLDCNCDICSADCRELLVDSLNALIAQAAPSVAQAGLSEEQIAHLAAAHTNSVIEFDRLLKFARAILARSGQPAQEGRNG